MRNSTSLDFIPYIKEGIKFMNSFEVSLQLSYFLEHYLWKGPKKHFLQPKRVALWQAKLRHIPYGGNYLLW